jgi:hypothetical protein
MISVDFDLMELESEHIDEIKSYVGLHLSSGT